MEGAEGGGGDKCALNSAIATATLAPREGIFLIFFNFVFQPILYIFCKKEVVIGRINLQFSLI